MEPLSPHPTRVSACLHAPNGVEQMHDIPQAELAGLAALKDGRTRWLRIEGFADQGYLQAVADAFGLHHLALEDVQHNAATPKLEAYEHGYFLILPRFHLGRRLHSQQVSLFLGEGWVISLAPAPVTEFDQVSARLSAGRGKVREGGADRLFHNLADAIIDSYPALLTGLDEQFARLDARLQGRRPDSVVYGLREMRADLFRLYMQLGALQSALGALVQDRDDWLDDEVQPYVKDLQDHVAQASSHVASLREAVGESQLLYQAILGQRTNDTMRVLTVMSAIFLPLTFIVGVYGMNFQHMPELAWPWGYPLALLFMLSVALGLLAYFNKRGWLGRQDPRTLREQSRRAEDDPEA